MPRLSSSSSRKRSQSEAAPRHSAADFHAGQVIERSGIYQVFHAGNRATHKVRLIAGDAFPRCAGCAQDVRFRLWQPSAEAAEESPFRVRLYEIPHPASSAEQDDEVA